MLTPQPARIHLLPAREALRLNHWEIGKGRVPFRIEPMEARYGGEDLSVVYPRMERDGWKRSGEKWGEDREVTGRGKFTIETQGDDGWDMKLAEAKPCCTCANRAASSKSPHQIR
jgi:hypothetical protein